MHYLTFYVLKAVKLPLLFLILHKKLDIYSRHFIRKLKEMGKYTLKRVLRKKQVKNVNYLRWRFNYKDA